MSRYFYRCCIGTTNHQLAFFGNVSYFSLFFRFQGQPSQNRGRSGCAETHPIPWLSLRVRCLNNYWVGGFRATNRYPSVCSMFVCFFLDPTKSTSKKMWPCFHSCFCRSTGEYQRNKVDSLKWKWDTKSMASFFCNLWKPPWSLLSAMWN